MGNANNLELNKGDNFIFAVDVSGSMSATDCPGGASRINFLKEQVTTFITEAEKYDTDGIDLITFGHKINTFEGVTAEKANTVVKGLAANEGATDTAGAIRAAWKLHEAYVARGGQDQTVLFIATDGAPSDPDSVKTELRKIAKLQEADNERFSVSFLRVGNDAGVAQFLSELDDNLKAVDKNGAPIDIVDFKELTEVNFLEAFVGAVHD